MTHPHMITDAAAALEFAFGGNARFTLVSRKTGDRKTFRISRAKSQREHEIEPMFFAALLTGPDNTADYTYLGFTRQGWDATGLRAGNKGQSNHPAYQALDWALRQLRRGLMPEQLEFWHEGRCSRCARVLTDPASIERGVGPECAKKED